METIPKSKTSSEVIAELMTKKTALIKQRDAEIVRLNGLAPLVKQGVKYELMPGLTAEQLKTAQPIIAMQSLLKTSVIKGAVDGKFIRKIVSKVDNKEYEHFNKLTTDIKQIAKDILSAELGTVVRKSNGGTHNPVTDDTIKAKNQKWFKSLNPKKVAQYQITYDPARGTLNSKFNNSPQRYPDMIEKAMVKEKVAPDRTAS